MYSTDNRKNATEIIIVHVIMSFFIGMLNDKKRVYDKCLEALKAAAFSSLSIGIFISAEELKQGMSWDVFKASIHLLKDANTGTRHIRLAFEDNEAAIVLKRKIERSKRSIRNSLV